MHAPQTLDTKDFLRVMVYICDTFSMTHPQMIALRKKVLATHQTQPQGTRKLQREMVSVQSLGLVVGLLISFGGTVDQVVAVEAKKLIELARPIDKDIWR